MESNELGAEFKRLCEDVSNWGRWGPEDDAGTLNLITPEKTLAALSVARRGRTVPLARKVTLGREQSVHLKYRVSSIYRVRILRPPA